MGEAKDQRPLDLENAQFYSGPGVKAASVQEWVCAGCGEHMDPGPIAVCWVSDGERIVLVAGHPGCLEGADAMGYVDATVDRLKAGPDPTAADRALNAVRRAAGDFEPKPPKKATD